MFSKLGRKGRQKSSQSRPILSTYKPRTRKSTLYEQNYRKRQKRKQLIASSITVVVVLLLGLGVFTVARGILNKQSTTKKAAVEPSPSAEATQTAKTPPPSIPTSITINAVGDMIFDRKVKTLVNSAGGDAPLANVASILKDADVTVGNLESPLSDAGTQDTDKDVTFRGTPKGIKSITNSGFDLVTLANNHMLDYGPKALEDTLNLLDENNVGHAGAGMNKKDAWKPAVIERNGSTIAYLGFSDILPPGFVAGDSKPGIAAGRTDMKAVEKAIKAAKAEYDYVLVAFHWGIEYQDDHSSTQEDEAHRAVDAGADMVLSHHPHVIQGVEFYKKGFIAYSLGDFVFDHYSRKTGEAFILNATLGPDGVSDVSAIPVYLNESGAPHVVTGSEAKVILERLKKISPSNTVVKRDGDIATITEKK